MINLDQLKKQKQEIVGKINQAIKDGNEEAFQSAFVEYTDILQEAVMAEAKGLIQAADNQVLAGRGARALTSKETEYYQKVIDAMKAGNPKQSLANFDDVLPKTVIDAVFEDITEDHPLLGAINFQNTAALVEYLYSTMDGRHLAFWGPLCADIIRELNGQFHKLNLEQTKLSAFLPICKAMLDLGPAWLDRYVRTILYEAVANGLEDGIITGRGIAEGAPDPADRIFEPIGMIKDLTQFNLVTGYADKVPVPISNFSPEVYGGLISALAVGRNGLHRVINEVLLVVNPVDYLTKVLPATTFQTPNGTYATNIFPFPTKVIQSAYMPLGQAALGIAKRYLMAMGTGKAGKIEYSDEYRFLEDERVYLIKLYGTGRPLDNTSFLLLDISDIKPVHPIIRITDYVDARLADIALTDELTNDIDLVFSENIHSYSVAVADSLVAGDNNTLALEAVTNDVNAVIAVTLNDVPVVDVLGAFSLVLAAGQNVIVVTSTIGAVVEAYVIVVDYTPVA